MLQDFRRYWTKDNVIDILSVF